ncbi:hypothetical protein BELL_1500g00020 [Botrytis elliptica]|uniref:Uncharacterized protein n=1 Tax=Botrytis elliptica TaxID=278938 RepID=A0A4Z1IDA9_9HELO|nr:hypothetical protein BELL_1500g00020 [Botrytis elliptica]
MLSDDNSRHLLYVCAGLSTFTAYKHTSLGFSNLFPKIDRGLGSSEPLTAFSAKSNFLQVGASWALIDLLQRAAQILHKDLIIEHRHIAET